MIGKLSELVSGEQVVTWLVICFIVAYFIYKEWPGFRDRAAAAKNIADRLASIEMRLDGLDEKLANDYRRINELERDRAVTRRVLDESLEEREIIMRALLGALGGLQELGANGPTKKAVTEINDYLNRRAHSGDMKEG